MDSALTIQNYLALNQGRYLRETISLPPVRSRVYVTTHFETAATDLLHYHETPHFSFVLKGGVIDRRRHAETEKRAGELMFFPAGQPHRSIYRNFPVRSLNIEIEADFFGRHGIDEAAIRSSVEQSPAAKFTMLKIYRELAAADEFTNDSIEMLLLKLLEDRSGVRKARPAWLDRVVERLHDDWNEELSLDELARAAGVHPKTVSKYFSRHLGCTLGEYRRRLRIEKALPLIKTSNLSLTAIAHQCGFYDQSHFTAAFKRLTGFRPKHFQKL
ncbi:MAG: helix-turn-helix transcriptional regulator [Acidobacteria bacterium]|nr:helix-turn-helix transcriptional regulator [Acidobacteriota bacterium]